MAGTHRCLHEADLGMKVTKLRAGKRLKLEQEKYREKCMLRYPCKVLIFPVLPLKIRWKKTLLNLAMV